MVTMEPRRAITIMRAGAIIEIGATTETRETIETDGTIVVGVIARMVVTASNHQGQAGVVPFTALLK